jgi:hypothetical protein
MKTENLVSIMLAAMLMGGCCTTNHHADVTGRWNWVCCDGHYDGELKLTQFSTGEITGTMCNANGEAPGTIKGSLRGNYIQFTRTWSGYHQQYSLALSPDGRTLIGTFDGVRDATVSANFEAKRN